MVLKGKEIMVWTNKADFSTQISSAINHCFHSNIMTNVYYIVYAVSVSLLFYAAFKR